MTPADLALITAFWLLLMLLRLPLRVDPRYRGRRRVGDPRPGVPLELHDSVVPEPWVPPLIGVEDHEYTEPIKTWEPELGRTYVSRSRRLNGTDLLS